MEHPQQEWQDVRELASAARRVRGAARWSGGTVTAKLRPPEPPWSADAGRCCAEDWAGFVERVRGWVSAAIEACFSSDSAAAAVAASAGAGPRRTRLVCRAGAPDSPAKLERIWAMFHRVMMLLNDLNAAVFGSPNQGGWC